jgi:predicted metal-dependent hydrolase
MSTRRSTRLGACCFALGVLRLSKRWWTDETAIDELLIHELAHLTVSDHLSDAFHTECCRLGARLRNCKARLSDHLPAANAA